MWMDKANRTHNPLVDHLSFHARTFRRLISHLGHAVLFMVTAMHAPLSERSPMCTQVLLEVATSAPKVKEAFAGRSFACVGECREPLHTHASRESQSNLGQSPGTVTHHASQQSTTSFLTAAMLVYTLHAGITAAAGTRLAHKLILAVWFG